MRYGQVKYKSRSQSQEEKPIVRDKRTFSRTAFDDILKQNTEKAQQTINKLTNDGQSELTRKEEDKDE